MLKTELHQRCEVGDVLRAGAEESGRQTRWSAERSRVRAISEPRNIATARLRAVMPQSNQKNFNQSMKTKTTTCIDLMGDWISRHDISNTIIYTFLVILASFQVVGQVQVSMTIPNLGSPYLSEYVGNVKNQVLVLTNTTGNTQQVMLRGKVEQLSRPGYFLRTKENYRPSAPITLLPFETRTFFANPNDFAFLNESNLENNVPSSIQRQIQATGILPEGEYQICVQAFDYNTRQALSGEAPIGCQFFFVTLGTPPQIIQPICGDTIQGQFPIITWVPATSLVPLMDIQYDLYLVELMGRSLNPMEVMEQAINYGGGNPIIIKDIRTNTYMFSPRDIPLKLGKRYVACVVARNGRNGAMFENNGRSEICQFFVKAADNVVSDPVVGVVMSPSSPPGAFGTLNPDFVSLPASVKGILTHRFKDQQLENVELVMAREAEANDLSLQNLNPSQLLGSFSQFASQSAVSTQVPTLMANQSTGIQLASHTSGFGGYQLTSTNNGLYNNNGMFFEANPYNSGSLPLPFTSISLVEEYYGTNVGEPTKLSDFDCLDGYKPFSFNLPFSLDSRVLATTTTNNTGAFNFNVSIDRPCGVVMGGSDMINYFEVVPTNTHDFSPQALKKSYKKIFRIIRLVVQDGRYCSPDVMLFLQPGGQLDVGRQAALVKSYKMRVNVRASGGGTFADKNAPIAIKIMRHKAGRIQQGHGHPAFEPGSPMSNADQASYGDYWIYYKTYTDGAFFEIRNLVRHRDNTTSLYFMELSTDKNKKYNFKTKVVPFSQDPIARASDGSKTFNSNFNEWTIYPTIELEPDYPEIYLQTMYDGAHAGVASEPLPNVQVKMLYGIPGWNTTNLGRTDNNGKLRWRLNDFYMGGREEVPIQLEFIHPGYVTERRPVSSTIDLKYGMRYPAGEVRMRPRARVTLEVRDEDNKPIAAMVKIGDAPAVETVRRCSGVGSNALFDQFQASDFVGQIPNSQNQSSQLFSYLPAAFSQSAQVNHQQSQLTSNPLVDFNDLIFEPNLGNNQLPDPIISTSSNHRCRYVIENYPVPSGYNVQLTIMPFATVYDTLQTNVNIRPGSSLLDLGVFKVKFKRKKKYIFLATNEVCGNVVSPGLHNQHPIPCPPKEVRTTVKLHTVTRTTNRLPDLMYFEFPNNALSFRLKVDAGPDHIPINTFIDVNDKADTLWVVVREGKVKKGRVIDRVTREPIAGARVYFQNGTDTHGPNYVQTFTNSNGYFELTGIDVESSSDLMISKTSSEVTYAGASISIYPLNSEPVIELEPLDWDIQQILGFNVELNKVQSVPNEPNELILTGIITRFPGNSNFRPEGGNQIKIPFKDLRVRKLFSNSTNSRPTATTVTNHVDLEITTMPLVVNNNFLGLMRSSNGNKIRITKNGDQSGRIIGNVEIRLSSFNFENQFDARFYISRDSNLLNMWVFRSDVATSNQSEFFVGRKAFTSNNSGYGLASISYKVEGFPAISYRSESRLVRDTFYLPTTIQLSVPEMIPSRLDLEVGTIKVTEDRILVQYAGKQLNFQLEDWQVKSKNWYFNQSESSIIVPSADLITKSIQVKLTNLRMRNNEPPLNAGELHQYTGEASLSGVVPLQFMEGVKLHLRYYENIYSNGKKRYALQIEAPLGSEVACRAALPNSILTNGTIDIQYYHVYSNNVEYIGMKPSQNLLFYQVLPIRNIQIELYPNLFEISGTTHLNVPGLNTGAVTILRFTKPNQQINAELIGMSIQLNNMNGQVYYRSDDLSTRFVLTNGKLSAYGDLWVKENDQERFRLRSLFELTPSSCKISTFNCVPSTGMPGQGAQMQRIWLSEGRDANSEHLQVVSGSMQVINNSWGHFLFRGRMSGSGSSKGIKAGENELDFIVEGTVVALSGQKLGVNNMDTPNSGSSGFTFNTYFDFDKSALFGDWKFTLPAPLIIGALTIEGQVVGGFKFAPEGFYFYQTIGRARVHPIPGTLEMIFIVGATSINNIDTEAKSILRNIWKEWDGFPPSLTRIDGFFMGGNYTLFDIDFSVNILIVGIDVEIRAHADMYVALNFGNVASASFGVHVLVSVKVDAHVLFCSACAGVRAEVGLCGMIGTANSRIEGRGSVEVSGSLSCGPSFSHTVSMNVSLSESDGLKVQLGNSTMQSSSGSCMPPLKPRSPLCGT